MAKKNIITIDLDIWTTQARKAEQEGIKLSTLSRQVKRSIENDTNSPIPYWTIPELGITLVKKQG